MTVPKPPVPLLVLSWLAGLNCRAPLLALTPALPLVVRDLSLSFTVAGVVASLPLLLMGLLSLPGGWLTDRFGPRRTSALALALVTMGAFLRASSPNAAVLLLGTLLLGAGIGVLQPTLPRVARDALPARPSLGNAIYFNGLILGGVGSAAALPLVLAAMGSENWRGALIAPAIGAAITLLGWVVIAARERRAAVARSHQVPFGWATLRAAATLPGVPALALALGTQSAIFYTTVSWLPSSLTALGWPIESQALPLAALTFSTLAASFLTAPVEAWLGTRNAILWSGLLLAAGFVAFLVWPATAWMGATLVGVCTTIAFGISLAAPSRLAPPAQIGTTAGLMLTWGYLEATIGPLAIGALRDVFGSYAIGWLFMVLLSLVLAAAAFGVPRSVASA